jgi:hypothetical protein
VVGNASRAKYNGSAQASASPRVENIAEMAVQTDQIDLDQGFGRSTMQISFVTRSGTNAFHGRAYIDAQNSGLNANSYANNASTPIVRRPKEIYNDLGASLGGPILHDKLFFFGSFSTRRVPGDASTNDTYLPASVQAGNYTYVGTNGQTYTTDLFNLARTVGAPTTVNAAVAKQLSLINSSLASGSTITTADPNIDQVTWNEPTPVVYYDCTPIFRQISRRSELPETFCHPFPAAASATSTAAISRGRLRLASGPSTRSTPVS